MKGNRREYLAYLLRLWRAGDWLPNSKATNWRASLESPASGERMGFGSLDELFRFLAEEVMRCEAEGEAPADTTQFDL